DEGGPVAADAILGVGDDVDPFLQPVAAIQHQSGGQRFAQAQCDDAFTGGPMSNSEHSSVEICMWVLGHENSLALQVQGGDEGMGGVWPERAGVDHLLTDAAAWRLRCVAD